MLRTFNLGLSFFLELCMVAALAYWGFSTQSGIGKYLWGIGGPVVVILIWGAFIAPKARQRLPDPLRLLNEVVLFGLAALALLAAGQQTLGIIFFVLVFINLVLGFVLGQR